MLLSNKFGQCLLHQLKILQVTDALMAKQQHADSWIMFHSRQDLSYFPGSFVLLQFCLMPHKVLYVKQPHPSISTFFCLGPSFLT